MLAPLDVSTPPTWALGELRLRALRPTDADAWLAILEDPEVVEHTSYTWVDREMVRAMIAKNIDGYAAGTSCRWAIADARDTLVGTCGFSRWALAHAHTELVYDLARTWWGHGHMRAAIDQVVHWAFSSGFHRIHAYVMTTNARSMRRLESLGFAREGTLRHFRISRGIPKDFHVYARLHPNHRAR